MQSAHAVRIAVLHEWIDAYAGSEQVFEAIAASFPDADLFALTNEPSVELALGGRPVTTTALDRPWLRDRRSLTLALMPIAWRALGRRDYDVVLSSHHSFAHTNRLAGRGVQLCYVHSPARYLWAPEIDARGSAGYLRPLAAALRQVDRRATRRVAAYAANSSAVAERIACCWGRQSRVIHPPVRVDYFGAPGGAPTRDYVLGVGRWIPYKNLHLVIEAADLAGMPVKIAGRGPDKSRLVAAAHAASVPVELIESPNDEQLRELYRNAACLMFPTVEDFGIVAVEAQAAGTAVVAPAEGGVLDTVVDGRTGLLLQQPSVDDYAGALTEASKLDSAVARSNAQRFSGEVFARRFTEWVRDVTS